MNKLNICIHNIEYGYDKKTDTINNLLNNHSDKIKSILSFGREVLFNNEFIHSLDEGDWILKINSNEIISGRVIDVVYHVINSLDVEVIYLPTINISESKSVEVLQKEGHQVNGLGWFNFPDLKPRLFKVSDQIQWLNDRVIGSTSELTLQDKETAIVAYHK